MAEKKKSLSTQLSSEPETDARPSSPLSSISSLPGGLQPDRRNHPSGAIPRTQQGTVQHDSSYSSFEDSGIQASEEHHSGSGSKLYPSGYKSIKHGNSSGQKETSLSDDELIRRYQQDLEDESLKVGYYDVMIIYCEEDREKAEAYKDHLNNDIKTKAGKHIKAVLFDDAELESLAGSKFAHLEKAFERCTFAFVYLTKEFCENDDGWCRVSSEECLMKAIYDKDKKWCVVPVYTVQRNKADFKIPMGLNALKGVNYYNNDEFYRRGLIKLLGDKLFVRENNEKMHHERVVLEIKNHIIKEREREQRFLLKRQFSEREARQQEERHQQQIYAMAQQNQASHRYAFPSSPVYTDQGQDPITSKQPESIPGKSTDFDESLENLRDALEQSEFKDTSRPNEEGSGEPISPPRSLEPDSPVSEPSHGKYDPSTKGIHKSQITNHLPQGHYFPVQQGPHIPGQHRPGQQHAPGQYPQGQHAPGQYPQDQHPPGQHPPGQHPPGQYPQGQHQPGKQPHQSKLRQAREVVEIHHHHHYKQPPPPDEAEKTTQKVYNIINAKVVQIGEGGRVVSTEGGRLVEDNVSDTDSSSDSEHQAHVKKGGVDESIPSADGCSTTQDNLTTDMHKACTTSPQLNKNKDTNTNNHNDDEQTQVKTIDEGIVGKVTAAGVVTTNEVSEKMVMANKMPDKNSTANKMPYEGSTTNKMPEKSLESLPTSQGLSFNSMMSDKSHFPQTKKIKPFSVNKLNNAKPVVSVPPMQKVSPTRTNDMDNLLNNVIGGSNDRELEDPMDADYMNSLKRQRDQTYTDEKEISDETDEKVTYSEETSVKRLTDSDETEVKQYYSAPEQDRNVQGHTLVAIGNQVKPGQTSVTTGNQGHNDNVQTSDIRFFNHTDDTPRNNVYTKKSTNINVTSPGSSVDPEETNVLKPVSNFGQSGDLDIDGGDLGSLPSSIHSSNDFTILQSYSDNLETLTNEDKEVNAVQQVLEMGFPEARIKKCLNELQRSNPGRKHFSVPDLLDKLTRPQPEGNEGQTQVHKSATEPMLSKKSDLPSRPMSQPTSSGPHGSGSTKDKCCVS